MLSMTPAASDVKMCTKCTVTPATEKHQWCKPCKAAYQREYEALKGGMAETRGFHKGVGALRKVLVTEFDRLGSGKFSGTEIADLIEGTPAPQPSE